MRRIARIVLLVCIVSLGTVPVLAWGAGGGCGGGGGHGGGGHGAGGHGDDGHAGGAYGGGGHHAPGHAGFAHGVNRGCVHGFNRHGAFFGGAICRGCGYLDTDMSDFEEYLDRIGSTPRPSGLIEEDLDEDDRWSGGISGAQEEAQYRYDHRTGGD